MWHGSSSLRTPGSTLVDYNPRTRQLHEITIRTFYGFRVFDPEARRLLLKEIAGMVRSQLKPKVMLWRCIDALVREKIEVPSYTRLTKLILGAINRRKSGACRDHRADPRSGSPSAFGWSADARTDRGRYHSRQNQRLQTHLDKKTLGVNPAIQSQGARGGFGLGSRPLRSTEPNASDPRTQCREGSSTTPRASSNRRSSSSRAGTTPTAICTSSPLSRTSIYRLQDNLVDVLLTSLRSFQNGAMREHKEQCYARREQRNEALKTLLGWPRARAVRDSDHHWQHHRRWGAQ